jgi:hypothetical protein
MYTYILNHVELQTFIYLCTLFFYCNVLQMPQNKPKLVSSPSWQTLAQLSLPQLCYLHLWTQLFTSLPNNAC